MLQTRDMGAAPQGDLQAERRAASLAEQQAKSIVNLRTEPRAELRAEPRAELRAEPRARSRRWRRTMGVGWMVLAGATGCASSRRGEDVGGRVQRSDVIDRSQLAKSSAQNAYDAVRTLRPVFLASRGPTSLLRSRDSGTSPVIYLDNARFGDLSTLRNIPVDGIFEIRYFSATQAQLRFGMDHPSGAILVLTGSPRRLPDSK